jgi:hypothetical protein
LKKYPTISDFSAPQGLEKLFTRKMSFVIVVFALCLVAPACKVKKAAINQAPLEPVPAQSADQTKRIFAVSFTGLVAKTLAEKGTPPAEAEHLLCWYSRYETKGQELKAADSFSESDDSAHTVQRLTLAPVRNSSLITLLKARGLNVANVNDDTIRIALDDGGINKFEHIVQGNNALGEALKAEAFEPSIECPEGPALSSDNLLVVELEQDNTSDNTLNLSGFGGALSNAAAGGAGASGAASQYVPPVSATDPKAVKYTKNRTCAHIQGRQCLGWNETRQVKSILGARTRQVPIRVCNKKQGNQCLGWETHQKEVVTKGYVSVSEHTQCLQSYQSASQRCYYCYAGGGKCWTSSYRAPGAR